MIQKTIRGISDARRENKWPHVRQSTLAAYMLISEDHISLKFSESNELHENDVQGFVLEKLEGGSSAKPVRDISTVLRMVMKFRMKNEWVNYYEWDIKYPTDVTGRKSEVLSTTNHKKILNYIQSHFSSPGLGTYVSLNTGLRIGEICTLKQNDINVYDGILTVNRTTGRIYIMEGEREHAELIINIPKTRNFCRETPINKELLTMLKSLKKVVSDDYYILINDKHPTEPRTYRSYYKRLMEKLDIPKLKYHGLRHSFATCCIEVDCDYETVSMLLEYSNISATLNLYVHPSMEQKKRRISKASELLGEQSYVQSEEINVMTPSLSIALWLRIMLYIRMLLKILLIRRGLIFSLGIIIGCVLTIAVLLVIGITNSNANESGIMIAGQRTVFTTATKFKVLQVPGDGILINCGKKGYSTSFFTGPVVYIVIDGQNLFCDDQIIEVPKSKKTMQIGTLRYEAKFSEKIVPIIKLR